jgi:alpha-tubulin suppressor-like RCC1 family protein
VSAGEDFTCGITSTGQAMCWGSDSSGQAGNGAGAGSGTPAAVSGGLAWDRINAGRETACGVTDGGAAYCWGFNNTGEIGDGSTDYSDVPVAVTGSSGWSWIDNGDYHTCAFRTNNGEARCWGYALQGQLGNGSTQNNPSPSAVAGGHTWRQ